MLEFTTLFFVWFDFGSRRWAWVVVGVVASMGCWSGSVVVGQWLLAEVGGSGFLGLGGVLLSKGGCWRGSVAVGLGLGLGLL